MKTKYKVTLTFPYAWPLMRQTEGGRGAWGNYQFYLNDEIDDCDFWIVFTDFNLKKEMCDCPQENVVFLPSEPFSIAKFTPRFLKQFSLIITCQREIIHSNVSHFIGGHPWFVNKSYDELVNIDHVTKTRKISLITSNKVFTDGHKKRLEFAYKLKDYFNDDLDMFGRGINDFDDKWHVLAPYDYSITMENSYYDDYLSEKFFDCLLAYTHPLYYGCPNAEKYFSDQSFSRIDIKNFDASVETIETILNDKHHYQNHLNYVRAERLKVLNKYNLFPLLVSYMENMNGNAKKQKVTISPQMSLRKYLSSIKKIIKK